jgi:4-hydroxy-2-oxoheptanedioate aldolase
MTGKELALALRSGKRVYSTAILSPSPSWPPAVASTGIDFVFIDTEHIAIDRHPLSWMCRTYRAMGIPPIVRIPSPDPFEACKVLDGGACGVIGPYIETADQVRALSGAVKFRPLKGRRLYDMLEGKAALEPELLDYLTKRNEDNVLMVNIESVHAMENLGEILDVPGLGAVKIGPHDLSCSLGVPEKYDHPKFLAAVSTIVRKARAKGVGAGIHFSEGIEPMIRWAKEDGMNMIINSSDAVSFSRALRADFDRMRAALDDAGKTGAGDETIV